MYATRVVFAARRVRSLILVTTFGDEAMSLLNESKSGLLFAMLALATSGTCLLASAAAPQTTALPVSAPVPSGTILPFGGTVAPAGYLLCDGTEVQRADYPRLFATVGEAFGATTVFTFTLPDLRGRFLRGVDGAATNDPDRNSRVAIAPGGNVGNNVGSLQGDARRGNSGTVSGTTASSGNHSHSFPTWNDDHDEDDGNPNTALDGWADDKPSGSSSNNTTDTQGAHTHTFSASVTLAGDAETRPKNVYVNYIIKI